MLVDVEVGMYQIGCAFAMLRHSNGQVNRQLKLTRALALRSRANGQGNRRLKLNRALALRIKADERTTEPTKWLRLGGLGVFFVCAAWPSASTSP